MNRKYLDFIIDDSSSFDDDTYSDTDDEYDDDFFRNRNHISRRFRPNRYNENEEEYLPIHDYIDRQRTLLELAYHYESILKQTTKIPDTTLIINPSKLITQITKEVDGHKISFTARKWMTQFPVPKNLIAPEYLINTNPIYINNTDIVKIKFLDDSHEPIQGTVIEVRNEIVKVVFYLDIEKWKEECTVRSECKIVVFPSDIIFKRSKKALRELPSLNPDIQKMLCGILPKELDIPDMDLNLPRKWKFNESQEKAVRMAISNPFSLIQGPPGTGKTHTIGAITIMSLRMNPGKKVVVCGTTNVSINSLLEIVGDMVTSEGYKVCWPAATQRDFTSEINMTKEEKYLTLYQMRHLETPFGQRFRRLHDKAIQGIASPDELQEMNQLRHDLEIQVVRDSDVIVTTLDSSGKSAIMKSATRHVSTLIVDEATLSVETSMIIPLALLPDRFVLVGDHKQLGPPPCISELEEEQYYISIFERIIAQGKANNISVMLNTQYRMHPTISRLPNKLFYDNKLLDGIKGEDRKIVKTFLFQKPFNFIDVNGEEEQMGNSYINREEASVIVRLVKSLLNNNVDPLKIGVISAYGAQAKFISQTFRNNRVFNVKVSTIDSFQGSERDYIIISTSRTTRNLGFLIHKQRMNVAITRARCFLAVVGCAKALSTDDIWKQVVEYAKGRNSFYDKIPDIVGREKKVLPKLVITKGVVNVASPDKVEVNEFKEEEADAGYKLSSIYSEVADDDVRILWPDEENDVQFLNKWVKARTEKLDEGDYVSLVYNSTESVSMQFGDVFDESFDYYDGEYYLDTPEIKTNESIIISLYNHTGDYALNTILIDTMKPLLEHPRLTLLTFDFTEELDTLYKYGIKIHTTRVIDSQLLKPSNDEFNKDFICSRGWESIGSMVKDANKELNNANLIARAKECIDNNNNEFPHKENDFLVKAYNYPQICKFTKDFLKYLAENIFYTAIVAVDVLSSHHLNDVKDRSLKKLILYIRYKKRYGEVKYVHKAFLDRDSFTTAVQAHFSNDSLTYQLKSYYETLSDYIIITKRDMRKIIPFTEEDKIAIHKRYKTICEIMTDQNNLHLGNIKNDAKLAYVPGLNKTPTFIFLEKEEEDQVLKALQMEEKEALKYKQTEEEALKAMGIMGYKPPKVYDAWKNLSIDRTNTTKAQPWAPPSSQKTTAIVSNTITTTTTNKPATTMTTAALAQQLGTLFGNPIVVKSKKRKGKNNAQQVNQTKAKEQNTNTSTNLTVTPKQLNTNNTTSNKKRVLLNSTEWPTL